MKKFWIFLIALTVGAQNPISSNGGGGGGLSGGSNLTTINAVPYVSAAGVLNQDAGLNMQPTTTNIPEGGLLVGQSTQQTLISGRGTDSGASNGVPYFRSTSSGVSTALDLFPNGNPVPGSNGSAWFDVCSNDLQPLNSSDWNCATVGASGYVFGIANGSLVSIAVSSNVGTATTLLAHNLVATNAFTIVGGPAGLAGSYTVSTAPTSTTFTFTTAGVSNGTYTNAGMSISTPGTVYVGTHNSAAGLAGSAMVLAGSTINFQDRIGTGATIIRGIWTSSLLQLGNTPTFKWYFNSGSQRMGSTVFERWSNSSDPDGTADTSISRISAGVLGVGSGATGSVAGAIQAAAFKTGTTCSSNASPAVCGSAAAGAVAIPTGVNSTLVVNTTAVTASSTITLIADDSLTIASTTCNSTLATLVGGMAITARTAGTSFTISFNGTITTNPVCVSYLIVN